MPQRALSDQLRVAIQVSQTHQTAIAVFRIAIAGNHISQRTIRQCIHQSRVV
ncbi:hypothetical protein KPSA3_04305 [Pseudomonas syringae pv. actinidiae]|uniref:Uncharacterized protein n=1 Tax=Pseudomonas syringae pv. actinidiae TaxID=103796 RepID=A0AAN4Q6A4_PSESF|nr:hypothetical protein KPSA3_04305 [Pseudomonas syringae pv. actinidiae]